VDQFSCFFVPHQPLGTCFGPMSIRYTHQYFSLSLVLEDYRSFLAKGPAAIPFLSEEQSRNMNLMVLDYRSLTHFRTAHLFIDESYPHPTIPWRANMSFRDIQHRFSLRAHWYNAGGEAMYSWDCSTQHGRINDCPASKAPIRECTPPVGVTF
jgi:hypothetical protein